MKKRQHIASICSNVRQWFYGSYLQTLRLHETNESNTENFEP